MSASHTILSRPDTLLGICQAVGDDFGFNPTWLRVLLCCGIFFNLTATVAGYLILGVFVVASRWMFPAPAQSNVAEETKDAPFADAAPVEPILEPVYQQAA